MDLKDPWLPCMFYLDAAAAFSRWLMPVATVIMSTFRMLNIDSRSVIQFRSDKSESSQPILKFGIHRKFPYLCRPAVFVAVSPAEWVMYAVRKDERRSHVVRKIADLHF